VVVRTTARVADAVTLPRVGARRRPGHLVQEERFAWLLAAPSLLVLVVMTTLPLLALVVMSTFRLDLTTLFRNRWIGLDNYGRMLTDARFLEALRITAVYTVTTVALQVGLGLALALAFFRLRRGMGTLQVAVLLPMILAPIVVGLAWKTLMLTQLYGLVDYVSMLLGLGSHPWLTDPTLALVSIIIIHTWQWTPFAFLVFLASLYALPPEPFEAARIDRANAWQVFRHLTLPMLRSAIFIVVIFRTMVALRAFEGIFATTGGGPGTATEILNLYAYRVSFNSLSLGYGAALGTVLLLLTTLTSAVFFWLRREREADVA
jgi:multiple sugar transport system permease protein